MAPERDASKRVGRKLTKKRKPLRHTSVQYPERLKEGDDAQEDVTAAKGTSAQCVQQSVFSMIAAAGSKADFHSRFDDESSDSEGETHTDSKRVKDQESRTPPQQLAADQHEDTLEKAAHSRHLQRSHEHDLLKSLPKLNLRAVKDKSYMSRSSLPSSAGQKHLSENAMGVTPRDAPVMSRMLEAEAQFGTATELPESKAELMSSSGLAEDATGHSNLANRLREIFGFDKAEEVISGPLSLAMAI